ncbi:MULTISPECIES: hypothetical protein [Veillonella]|jgi:translation initiation factor IF-2, N-terminal domain protein|uniref:hypothetical protein n=1 Tax=Veillonella TaxID=29465 RepID=UPI00249394D0|nr:MULTISPECIES: hypothetical protein [Veillonella]MDU5940850.1 hypothetical protein [Veillonella sp.]
MGTEKNADSISKVTPEVVQEIKNSDKSNDENILLETSAETKYDLLKEALEAKAKELEKFNIELVKRAQELEVEKFNVHQKQVTLDEKYKTAEFDLKLKIDKEYADAKSELLDEQAKISSLFTLELDRKRSEFEETRQNALSKLDKELEEIRAKVKYELDILRKQQETELNKERKNIEKEYQEYREEQKKKLKEDRDIALGQLDNEIKERRDKLEQLESLISSIEKKQEELDDREVNLDREQRRLSKEKTRINECNSHLQEIVGKEIEDTINTYLREIERKDSELDKVRTLYADSISKIESLKRIEQAYGMDPAILEQRNKQLLDSNQKLLDELTNSIDIVRFDQLNVAFGKLKTEVGSLREENICLLDDQERLTHTEAQLRALDSEYKSLLATCESLENQLEEKNEELVRLSKPEGRLADREARIATIKTDALDEKKDLIGAGGLDSRYNKKDEITWLEDIWKKCKDYGIEFNKRILYAFHTALKINEWSTITVLAGVSGTGKSELPRLYSEFGGLNFCSVAVQPNWDSQESMLGFFNSIDNQFEPEELLKFLVQCISDSRYNEYMSIVLLDEMNLAHVEHYFAEFLSKLESRRGLKRSNLPEVEVKLGAGVKPYGLKLSRTVLWTGTMNQDETTKSLSDKVLDRGIVINFPRPKTLVSRSKMGLITDYISDDRAKLHKDTWQSWTSHKIDFSEEQMKEIDKYRNIVQEINDALEGVGRALGHRVWQSIEYYIANYPTVRQSMGYQPIQNEKGKLSLCPTNNELTGALKDAMRTAFEDQIVQKIMPKLRGIETRDKRGKNSLDKIENLLITHNFESLQEDFQIAREQGYGQFIWNSAKYLDDKDEKELKI